MRQPLCWSWIGLCPVSDWTAENHCTSWVLWRKEGGIHKKWITGRGSCHLISFLFQSSFSFHSLVIGSCGLFSFPTLSNPRILLGNLLSTITYLSSLPYLAFSQFIFSTHSSSFLSTLIGSIFKFASLLLLHVFLPFLLPHSLTWTSFEPRLPTMEGLSSKRYVNGKKGGMQLGGRTHACRGSQVKPRCIQTGLGTELSNWESSNFQLFSAATLQKYEPTIIQ